MTEEFGMLLQNLKGQEMNLTIENSVIFDRKLRICTKGLKFNFSVAALFIIYGWDFVETKKGNKNPM